MGIIEDETTDLAEIFVGATGGGFHVVDMISKGEVLLTLVGKLLTIVLVPGQCIGFVLLLEAVQFLRHVGEDAGSVTGELEVLLAVVFGFLEGLT